jgi:hypothetical protein
MRSGMATAKALLLHKSIIKENDRILNGFAASPSAKYKAATKVTKMILLNSPYLLHGKYFNVKAKSLGAGVYELKIELEK